jgi:hypothetical protein
VAFQFLGPLDSSVNEVVNLDIFFGCPPPLHLAVVDVTEVGCLRCQRFFIEIINPLVPIRNYAQRVNFEQRILSAEAFC